MKNVNEIGIAGKIFNVASINTLRIKSKMDSAVSVKEFMSKASETKIVSSGGAVFMANERVDVVAGTKLNTFGGNGETHAALKKNSIFSAVLAILGGNATLETTGVDLAKSIFGLEG